MHTYTKSTVVPAWLRWIGVLPMAVIGGILGYCVSKLSYTTLVADRGYELGQGGTWDFVVEFIAATASAMLAVYFGCRTAPRFRRWVYAFLVALLLVYNYPSIKSLFVEFESFVLIGVLGTAVGAFAGSSVWNGLKED